MKRKSFYFYTLFSNVKQVRQMLFITTGYKSHDSWWIALSPSIPGGNCLFARLELIFQAKEKNKTKPRPKSCSLAQQFELRFGYDKQFHIEVRISLLLWTSFSVSFVISFHFEHWHRRKCNFPTKIAKQFSMPTFSSMVWMRWLWLQNTIV